MIAHRRQLVAFMEPRHQPVLPHQSYDPFAADVLVLLEQILVDARVCKILSPAVQKPYVLQSDSHLKT
jgi:hypothetical protein